MSQRHRITRLLVAAITTLLLASPVGGSGLVFCSASNGHRAIELEHGGTLCPTLATAADATGISVSMPIECSDLPAEGAGPVAASSVDPGRAPTPQLVVLALLPDSVAVFDTRFSASGDARADPPQLALHLTSTVLLV